MRSAEHHAGPVRDECLRRSEPKTAAATGDEVNPAVQSKIHPAILPAIPVISAPPLADGRFVTPSSVTVCAAIPANIRSSR